MKIVLLRDKGAQHTVYLSRKQLSAVVFVSLIALSIAFVWLVANLSGPAVGADVMAQWRIKLAEQRAEVIALEGKSQAQSAAVGRQLANMQARLLRMEAIGAHMADAADLPDGEFDFGHSPALGGPVQGNEAVMAWNDLGKEISELSSQLKRRELELNILDEVLVNEEISSTSRVRGRPVKWGWLSSPFGQRVDPISGRNAWHSGVDFAGRDGSDVIAVASGVVTYAGERHGYGKLVEISHADGYTTRYAHHKKLLVKAGDVVKKGETIGIMGSSGRSTGPHVHFEILKNGNTVNPARYVSSRS